MHSGFGQFKKKRLSLSYTKVIFQLIPLFLSVVSATPRIRSLNIIILSLHNVKTRAFQLILIRWRYTKTNEKLTQTFENNE